MQKRELLIISLSVLAIGLCWGSLTSATPSQVEQECAVKDDAFVIALPWAPSVSHTVLAGYGPNGGSRDHDGCDRKARDNSFYALDFDLAHQEPVYPVAEGRVEYFGWTGGGFDRFGKVVYIFSFR